jgi:hypothetical protein
MFMYIYKKRGRVSAGFTQVARVSDQPAGSTGFRRANSSAGFYLDPDWSQARVSKLCFYQPLCNRNLFLLITLLFFNKKYIKIIFFYFIYQYTTIIKKKLKILI